MNQKGNKDVEKIHNKDPEVNSTASVIPIESKGYKSAVFTPKWVSTKNEKKCQRSINMALKLGDGCFVSWEGDAGDGKTTIASYLVSNNDYIYLLGLETYKRSELPILQSFCRELGRTNPPSRSNDCLLWIVDRLTEHRRVIFLDEIDLIPQRINLIRQLAELTGSVFVLIGETGLTEHLIQNKRVWSRTFQSVYFEPIIMGEIILYGKESAGLVITEEAAKEIHMSPGGKNWRVVKRITMNLVEIANVMKTRIVTAEMAKQAIDMGLKGKSRKA